MKGFTFMVNLPTSVLKTGSLCIVFARVKFLIWGSQLVEKIIVGGGESKRKIVCLFLEAHQYVFSDFHHRKFTKILFEDLFTEKCEGIYVHGQLAYICSQNWVFVHCFCTRKSS